MSRSPNGTSSAPPKGLGDVISTFGGSTWLTSTCGRDPPHLASAFSRLPSRISSLMTSGRNSDARNWIAG